MADATFSPLENKLWFENSAIAWGNYWILYHKTNKEALTVLFSVVKHLGSGRALKKWGKTLDYISCFPLLFFRALPLPACFTTEHSTVEASLFVKCSSLLVMHMVLWLQSQHPLLSIVAILGSSHPLRFLPYIIICMLQCQKFPFCRKY